MSELTPFEAATMRAAKEKYEAEIVAPYVRLCEYWITEVRPREVPEVALEIIEAAKPKAVLRSVKRASAS